MKLFERSNCIPDLDLQTETIDGERFYVIPGGQKYRSVTSVLQKLSAVSIAKWRNRIGHEQAAKITRQASTRGTKLHSLAEKYLLGTQVDPTTLLPTTIDLFQSIKPIIDEHISVVHGIEFPLFSHYLRTAGRCDLFCDFKGINTIVDFKSSSKRKQEQWIESYFIQCSTYAMIIEERYNINVPQLAVIIAVENDQPQLFVKRTADYKNSVVKIFTGIYNQ